VFKLALTPQKTGSNSTYSNKTPNIELSFALSKVSMVIRI